MTGAAGGSKLQRTGLAQGHETKVLNIGDLESRNVVDVTVAGLGNGIEAVLLQDSFRGPLLDLAGDSDDTASSVLGSC